MSATSLSGKINVWVNKHINQRQFILLLAFVVGLISGFAAIVLKNTLHYMSHLLTSGFNPETGSWMYILYPVTGIFLTVLFIKFIVRDDLSHGVSKILYAISRRNSIIKPHNTWSSIVTSILTISFGGSVGAEAPVVLTGSAIGSNLGRYFHLNYKKLTLLAGCGAAGAIAGIFKAPLAGLVFVLEILMIDLTMASLLPLLISAVTAASLAYLFMGNEVLFTPQVTETFQIPHIPHYIILGILCGLVSLYVSRMTGKTEHIIQKIKNRWWRALVGGLALGLLIFIFPPLFGEGYSTLNAIFNGNTNALVDNSFFFGLQNNIWLLLLITFCIMMLKVVSMALTNGSGGVGGIFAPSLFIGGLAGFIAARVNNELLFTPVSECNFALVGMAGLLSGVLHAPMTAIFLIAEITGGYALFMPLIITSTISYLTIILFEKHSIYHHRLAERGELITHHKDKAVLSMMSIKPLIEKNFTIVDEDDSLRRFVQAVSKSERNVFPVINDDNDFLGVVFINDVRHIIFNHEMYDTTFVRDLMYVPDVHIELDESMESVARKFSKSRHYNIPVLDHGKYVGFVSRARVFSTYRERLRDFSDE
ncbi:MAG: chloride channel protein [Marinilabiliales bacterium]|nr:MAG: chloride channel protein [Marinilabiliales bacterium]